MGWTLSDTTAILTPDWPAPPNVRAVCSTRIGGCSLGRYASLNLGGHVQDNPPQVAENRLRYQRLSQMPSAPVWLEQVHGTHVVQLRQGSKAGETADAAVTTEAGVVATVMTADCLPLLLCDNQGTQVAAVHAGWRGLCNGIIEATVAHFNCPAQVMVYLGPAISQAAFEVGAEVRDAFLKHGNNASAAFVAQNNGKFRADLYQLARQRLHLCGVTQIYGGQYCTYQQADSFFSYRRDGQTGRMASSIWLI